MNKICINSESVLNMASTVHVATVRSINHNVGTLKELSAAGCKYKTQACKALIILRELLLVLVHVVLN